VYIKHNARITTLIFKGFLDYPPPALVKTTTFLFFRPDFSCGVFYCWYLLLRSKVTPRQVITQPGQQQTATDISHTLTGGSVTFKKYQHTGSINAVYQYKQQHKKG